MPASRAKYPAKDRLGQPREIRSLAAREVGAYLRAAMKAVRFVIMLALVGCQPSTNPPSSAVDAPMTSAPPPATASTPPATSATAPEPTVSAAPTTPPTTPAPTGAPTAAPIASGGAGAAQCAGSPPGPGYVCLQDCPPPVQRVGAPAPGYRWATPEQAASRKKFGCPICLSGDTRIATPSGEVRARELGAGSIVWTVDANGKRMAAPLEATTRVPIAPGHVMAHVTFDDGRELSVSPGHPTCRGLDARGKVADLVRGVRYDRSNVRAAEYVDYDGDATFDLRPAGPTGCYWANGVLLGSSLR
jgi:hypothetical protein